MTEAARVNLALCIGDRHRRPDGAFRLDDLGEARVQTSRIRPGLGGETRWDGRDACGESV
ncbi:MAG: hypothetical protein ACLFQ5_10070 [Oceanicaulis sp.]